MSSRNMNDLRGLVDDRLRGQRQTAWPPIRSKASTSATSGRSPPASSKRAKATSRPTARRSSIRRCPQDYPFYQIYTQPLAGGAPQLISTGRGRTTCSYFSPDGKQLIFASSHLDPQLSQTEEQERKQQADDAKTGKRRRYQWDFDPYMDIFEADLDGKNLRQLTNAKGYDAEGAYSPDGKLIAFCSDRDGDPDMYVMNADGTGVRQLTNAPGYDGGPFISPDGKWVIYRSDRKKRKCCRFTRSASTARTTWR